MKRRIARYTQTTMPHVHYRFVLYHLPLIYCVQAEVPCNNEGYSDVGENLNLPGEATAPSSRGPMSRGKFANVLLFCTMVL